MSDPVQPYPTLPLGSLAAEMCLGKMLDKEKNRGTLQPYLRNVNVRWFSFDLSDLKEMRFEDGEGTRFELQTGDLVICEGGEPGRAAVWRGQTEKAKIQKALHRVRFRPDEYDPTFAMYYLYFGTITNRFAPHYTGTTIKHLTGAALSQVEFPVPSVYQQNRIVAKIEELFSNLDAGVAALERAKVNLRRYRAAVLKAAVEGKLTEDWRAKHRNTEPASKLLARILAERRKKWEADQLDKFAAAKKEPPKNWKAKYVEPTPPDTSDLPDLPEGWCWATVDQVSHFVTSGSRGWAQYYSDDGPLFIRAQDINTDQLRQDRLAHVQPPQSAEVERTRVQKGDVLVTVTGANVTKTGFVDDDIGEAYVSQHVALVRPIMTNMVRYLHTWIICPSYGRALLERLAYGAGKPGLNLEQLRSLVVALPPIAEQTVIVSEADSCLSIAFAADNQLATLLLRAARLRQSILKQAFEGKLVPQDPKDEPAGVLLERITAAQNNKTSPKQAKRRKISVVPN